MVTYCECAKFIYDFERPAPNITTANFNFNGSIICAHILT